MKSHWKVWLYIMSHSRQKKPIQKVSTVQGKQPRSKALGKMEKTPRSAGWSPDQENCCWRISHFDFEHERWGKSNFENEEKVMWLIDKLKSFETRTWNEIKKDIGGKSHGNQSHDINIGDLVKDARDRLEELKLDDIETLYSLRLGGKVRLWGWKNEYCLEVIWFDQNHEIYPMSQ